MAGLGGNIGTEFNLRARMDGFTQLGGEDVELWYFDLDASNQGFMNDRFLPAVHIEPIEGELIQVHFQNASGMPHTIHLHGLDVDQLNDGVPQTSFVIEPGESYTYEFIAPHAGTYHYHCHVDTVLHYHNGMAGTVIVRPPDGSTDRAWDGGPTFDEEVLWHLNTFDLDWVEQFGSGPGTARHHPNVFMLNGKETADARIDPYTKIDVSVGQTVYLRVLNSCYQWGRVSIGGLPFEVVASDGRPMRQVVQATEWEIGPGERYDLLFTPQAPIDTLATVDYLDDYTGATLGQASTRLIVV